MLTALLLAMAPPTQAGGPVFGIARSGDGDSLTIGDTRVRLFGVDAPEFDQMCKRGSQQWACGAEAAERLSKLVTGRQVQCERVGTDEHDRVLGRCFVGTTDVNRAMVASGFATAFRRYSSDYVAAEDGAKAAKVGLWSGTFITPSEHRASTWEPRRATRAARTGRRPAAEARFSGGCTIKGNHSRRGEWIYHLPGMPYYERTRPEDIFCSEAEAQAAGYRRAKVQ